MNDLLKERMTRLAESVSPDAPDIPALMQRSRRRRVVVRTGQGIRALALVIAVTLPLFALLPLHSGSSGPTPPGPPHLVVDFGQPHQGTSGAHGGVSVSYAGMTIEPPGNYLEGVFPSFSHLMLPPGTPITFAGDSAGGSVRFALAKTDVTGHPSKTTPTVPGAYRMTISTGWVSATPRTTIIKPSFSAEIAVGTASPRSEPRVMIAVGRLGPTGSRIGISYRGRVVLPALVQNPPVDPDALVGPDLSARLRALTVPIGTRVVAVRGQISGGQLRAWTGADNSPASIGVKFDLLHGWLALVSGRYELSMAVQSPGSPQIWVTFMLNVEQGSQVTSSPGAPASDQAACAAAMASLVAHRAQLAADGKSAAKIAKAWPRVNESTCVVTSSGVVTFETSDGSRQITVSLNAGSSDSPQPASP